VRMRSMPPARPIELIFPSFMGRRTHSGALDWGASFYRRSTGPYLLDLYVGLVAAVLLIAGWIERKRGAIFVAVMALLSYIIAIGDHTPLLGFLHEAGLFRSIRYPEKFALLGVFTAIVFGARMFDEAFRGDRQLARVAIVVASLIAVAAASLFVFSYFPAYGELYAALWKIPNPRVVELVVQASRADWLTAAARAIAVASLFGLLLFRGPTRAWSLLVVVMLLVELGTAANRSLPRMPRAFFTPPPIAERIGSDPGGGRLFHEADLLEIEFDVPRGWFGDEVYWVIRNGLYPRASGSWGIESAIESDYDLTNLKPTRDLYATVVLSRQGGEDPFPPALLRLANIRWIVRHIPDEAWRQLRIGDARNAQPVQLFEMKTLPRYYFARALVRGGTLQQFLQSVESGPLEVALVDGVSFRPAEGSILSIGETANTARLDVEARGQAFLVASVTPHRYWRATIDGVETPLIRANIGFQGLVIPPGRHVVEMRYRNPVVLAGLATSAVALLALLAAALRPVKKV
jgi:hypothetical protein